MQWQPWRWRTKTPAHPRKAGRVISPNYTSLQATETARERARDRDRARTGAGGRERERESDRHRKKESGRQNRDRCCQVSKEEEEQPTWSFPFASPSPPHRIPVNTAAFGASIVCNKSHRHRSYWQRRMPSQILSFFLSSLTRSLPFSLYFSAALRLNPQLLPCE